MQKTQNTRLDRPVNIHYDHVLGPTDSAEITLVEYGSYECPHCRAANDAISDLRDRFGDRMRYVFRHRPIPGSELARRAAELVERASDQNVFWKAHIKLMTRSASLNEDDLREVTADLATNQPDSRAEEEVARNARNRVDADIASANASGVVVTPTFFINGRRYRGPWDEYSLSEAMLGTMGHRMHTAMLDFVRWGPSAGLLLLVATVLAITLSNTPLAPLFHKIWANTLGISVNGVVLQLPALVWINEGLLTVFFLVVGLEIKREFTVGHLASLRSAALPIAGAIGGMALPALIYILVISDGPWANGWGIPMGTDTAFAVALLVMLGDRVPVELRIFLTAAAVVDDIGGIFVVAIFYSTHFHIIYIGAAAIITLGLVLLNRARVYRVSPYLFLGVALWFSLYDGGVNATLAGVMLALFIPTRPPPNLNALVAQANALIGSEARHGEEVLRHGPSRAALVALDGIHDRLESPADRLLRYAGARSSYVVLPLFALANAGAVLSVGLVISHIKLFMAIVVGLVIGKPLGMIAACVIAVRTGIAEKPEAYSWEQLFGAAILAGIGFTMSLFVAGQAFPGQGSDFDAAKMGVFFGSTIAAIFGVALLIRESEYSHSK